MTDEIDYPSDGEPLVETHYSSGESVSETVVRALAAVEGVEPTELDPLYEAVDPEALDSLLGEPVLGTQIAVEFVASGYKVVVSSHGQITIFDGADGSERT